MPDITAHLTKEQVELIDVVNENDDVIDVMSDVEVHQQRPIPLHRYSQVIITNSKNEIVCQVRQRDMKNYPRTFDASVGEHVDSGETYLDAAMRGLPEELGVECLIEEVGYIENHLDTSVENMIGRLFVGQHDGPYKPLDSEVERLEFLTFAEAKMLLERFPYLICDNFKSSLKLFLKTKGIL